MPENRLPDLRHIDAGGLRLAYRERGSGPALVFVHGMGGNSINWAPFYDRFADRFRVVGWDAPGYGGSDDFTMEVPSVADYVSLLAEFLAALEIPAAHLVGHSYGGVLVTAFHATWPERVLSLTLAQPVVGGGPDDAAHRRALIAARAEEVVRLGADGFARHHAPRSCAPDTPEETLARAVAVTATMRPEGYLRQFRSLRHASILDWTRPVSVPAMVVSGGHDRTADAGQIARIVAAMPGLVHRPIEGIGHMIYLEAPDRFAALLEALVASHAGRRGAWGAH